jgi:hypothetical protein
MGKLMGWPTISTVCRAESSRGSRPQREFTIGEIMRLAALFDTSPWQLMTVCANCTGQPPAGFACLACGATARLSHQGQGWAAPGERNEKGGQVAIATQADTDGRSGPGRDR